MLRLARPSFFFSCRRRHTRWPRDWSSDVCSSDLGQASRRPRGPRWGRGGGVGLRRDGAGCARSSNVGRRRSRLSLETMRGVWTRLLDLAAVYFLLGRQPCRAAKVLPMIRDAIGGVTQRSAGRFAYVGLFCVALVLRLLVPLTTGGLAGAFGYDASVYYASGAALVHARVPYRDFILLHPPGAVLATAPAAWVGSLTSDQAGFAVVTMLFAAAGAANAVLVAAIARRLGLSRGASMVGGLFYAVWFGAVHAEYQSRLEPLANFLLLCGLLGYAGIGRRHGRRAAILCGAGLGAAACVKVWYAVPLAVVVGWLLEIG